MAIGKNSWEKSDRCNWQTNSGHSNGLRTVAKREIELWQLGDHSRAIVFLVTKFLVLAMVESVMLGIKVPFNKRSVGLEKG
jgi:hypothetical protein